jgi:putative intracellular protease/amidase
LLLRLQFEIYNYLVNPMKTIKIILVLFAFGVLVFSGIAQYREDANNSNQDSQKMKDKKVLFVLSGHPVKGNTGKPTGWYLSEAAHPWKVLTDAGVQVDFMSAKGGKPPVDGFDLNDPISKEFWENPGVQSKLENTLTPDQVKADDYDAIYYVGGHGAMWDLPDNDNIAKITANIYENNGVVGAVCHGPAGLVNVKLKDGSYLVDGKTVAAYTNSEEEAGGMTDVVPFLLESRLEERGANHVAAPNKTANVQVDGRLVTGQNPKSAMGVGQELLKLLKK